MKLSRPHRKTLQTIFEDPARSNITWTDVVKLQLALGSDLSEGRGSRVRVFLNGVRAVFHRPHTRKETDKSVVKSVRRFLTEAGFKPEE